MELKSALVGCELKNKDNWRWLVGICMGFLDYEEKMEESPVFNGFGGLAVDVCIWVIWVSW